MTESVREDILKLSVPEKLELVEEIWNSIEEQPDDMPLTDWQKAELDRRLEAMEREPDAGTPWEVVRERVLQKYR